MNNTTKLKKMAELAIFIAIIIVLKMTGFNMIHIGPLAMTFTMVPIAIGAMLLGPIEGAILGFVFGITSLYDAITGASGMTGFFFQVSPVHTVILCVVVRTLVGFLTGLRELGGGSPRKLILEEQQEYAFAHVTSCKFLAHKIILFFPDDKRPPFSRRVTVLIFLLRLPP